jgi:hypothetical protein
VNERDAGQAIETGADVSYFVAIEAVRPHVEGLGPIEVLATFVGDLGHLCRPSRSRER